MVCPRCGTESGWSEKMLMCHDCGYPNQAKPVEIPEVVSLGRVDTESGGPALVVLPKLVAGEPCPACGKKVGRRAVARERKAGGVDAG